MIEKTGIIMQARTGSSRLPKKMILPFENEIGILELIIIRLKNHETRIPIILATTSSSKDNSLEKIGIKHNTIVFRGDENNVLNRFIQAAEKNNISKIIRICADNPFLDLFALSFQINSFNKKNVDYWCYSLSDNTPTIRTHFGFWAEGVTLTTLKKIASLTKQTIFLEHVTNYIYTHPDDFLIHHEKIDSSIETENSVRLTIDTSEDFELAKKIYKKIKKENIPLRSMDIISFLKKHPSYLNIMQSEIIKNTK